MSLSISEVAQRFGIKPHTLRYYENEQILPAVARDANGQRSYNDTDLEWIQLVLCMRSTGMGVADIKQYVELCRLGDDTLSARKQIILNQKQVIEEELRRYQGLLAVVERKLAYYDRLDTP